MVSSELNDLTEQIIGAAIEVHRALGPGLLESIYHATLCYELELRKTQFEKEVLIPIEYKGHQISVDYRVDLIVEQSVLVELKAVEKLMPVHEAQLLTYLKLTRKKLGLLINFNVPVLKQGIRRRIL